MNENIEYLLECLKTDLRDLREMLENNDEYANNVDLHFDTIIKELLK